MIDGLVLTFVNIQDLKDAETMGELRTYFESIFDTVRQPLVVLDEKFMVVSANRYFFDTFKLRSTMVVGQSFYEIGDGAWALPKLKKSLDGILPDNATLDDFQVEQDFPDVGRKRFVLNARRLGDAVSMPGHVLLAIQEVAE